MIFRGVDANGNVLFGQGLGSFAAGQAALALDLAARLRSWKGGCFFAPNDGVDYKNLLEKGKEGNLVVALQNAILQTPGVVKINSFNHTFDPQTRALSVTASIWTVYTAAYQLQLDNITGATTR